MIKTFNLAALSVLGILPFALTAQDLSDPPYVQLKEHAYFGDIPELRKALGEKKTFEFLEKDPTLSSEGILESALEGSSYDVISLLVEYGYPSGEDSFDNLVPLLFPEDMMEIGKRIPDFKEKWGRLFILPALRGGNVPILEALVKLGVDLKPYANRNNYLLEAVSRRNMPYIKFLLQNGADPYRRQSVDFSGGSAVDLALALHSADLLEVLDLKKLHTKEAQQLREQYAPPPNSPFPGVWSNNADGFNVVAMVLYPDGTCTAGAAMSIMQFETIWKQTPEGVQIQALALPGAKNTQTPPDINLAYQNGKLVLSKKQYGTLTKEEENLYAAVSRPVRLQPIFIRIQNAFITADGVLWLQINNRHISVPISKLIAGAEAKKYGGPVPDNVLNWQNFEIGPIPDSVAQKAADTVVYVNRDADPKYSQNWDQLYFDENIPAVLAKDSVYTLFRDDSPAYDRSDAGKQSVSVYGYALLAAKPFSNGKNWLIFYLRPAPEGPKKSSIP